MSRWCPPALSLLALSVLASPWPEDWDSVGFSLAVDRFDLARFQPHAPGYPVFVLAAKLVHALVRSPSLAASLASALGGALCVLALSLRLGPRALLVLASPTLVVLSTSARADALGLGLTALALSVGASPSPRALALSGTLLSLGLGARPSYFVLTATVLALGAVRHRRAALHALAPFALTTLAWSAWLVQASGGLERLGSLARTQATGHFHQWGGSALTLPDHAARLRDALAGFAVDGLGLRASLPGGLAALAWVTLVARGVRANPALALWLSALAGPYALWALLAQNVADEPRHLAPVVLVALTLAAHGLSLPHRLGHRARVWSAAVAVGLSLALALPSLSLAVKRRTEPPPAVSAARWVLSQGPPSETLVFGGRSARELSWAGVPSLPVTFMGDVDAALERLPALPVRVFVTSEVRFRERHRGTLGHARAFCRHLGRAHPRNCLELQPYDPLTPEGR